MIDISIELKIAGFYYIAGSVTSKNLDAISFNEPNQAMEIIIYDNPVMTKFSFDGLNFGDEIELKPGYNYRFEHPPKAIRIRSKHYRKIARCSIIMTSKGGEAID